MKKLKYILLTTVILLSTQACEIGQQIDPNSPSINGLQSDVTISQLNNLVVGTYAQMRDQINVYYDEVGILGRDMYRFSGSDPRWVADLIGGVLDNNAFYTTRPYAARYTTVKNINFLLEALSNTSQSTITVAERAGYSALAKTIMAHELLMVLNLNNDNGIRIDVADPDNLGPFVSKDAAFIFIAGLLNDANNELNGAEFIMPHSTGFSDFNTPETFQQFNRALAARVAAYTEDFPQVLTLLNDSFLDISGDFDFGAYYVFSTSSGDATNPLFLPQNNSGEIRAAHPSFVTDALPGDTRVGKATLRTPDDPATEEVEGPGPFINSDLTSNYDVFIFPTNVSPVPIIKNEELIFLQAEAQIQTADLAGAVTTLNVIRNAYGLADYGGPITTDDLIDEMLFQKRYSLWNEGHRWIDMRRYGKFDELPLDRPGDVVHEEFPKTFDEVQLENSKG